MAKTIDKDAQFNQFLTEVLAAAPADQRDALKTALENPAVRSKASGFVLASADYSRLMDEGRSELTSAREALDKELADARAKIEGWQGWHESNLAEAAKKDEKLKSYEDQFGPLDGEAHKPGKKFLTIEEAEKALAQRDAFAIDTSIMLADFGEEYRDKLGERLNRKELIDFATKHSLRLDVAFQQFMQPKLEAKRNKDFEAQLKAAREEGAREERTKHNLPTLTSTTESYAPSHQKAGDNFVSRNSTERVNAAIEDFNQLTAGR